MTPDPEHPEMFCLAGTEGLLDLGNRCATHSLNNLIMDQEATRFHVWAQTPPDVWAAYADNGYSFHDAIKMEMSYL